MRSSGQVDESYIIQQWRSRDKESFYEFRHYLLLVLEKLDILCHAKVYDKAGKDVKTDFYTVPCMVNSSIPDLEFTQQTSVDISYSFCSVAPVAIFNRLVCACLVLWPVYKGHLYSGLVVLRSGQYHLIKLNMKGGKIIVSFVHLKALDRIDVHLCRTVRQFLNSALDSIMKTYKTDVQKLYILEYNNEAITRNFCNTDLENLVNMIHTDGKKSTFLILYNLALIQRLS